MLDLEIRRIVTEGKHQRIREEYVWEMLIMGAVKDSILTGGFWSLREQIHRFREGNVDATGRVERARGQQIEQVKPSLRRAFRRLNVFVNLGEPLTIVGRAAQHLEIEIDKAHWSGFATGLEGRQLAVLGGKHVNWSECPKVQETHLPLHPTGQQVPSPCRVSCSRCSLSPPKIEAPYIIRKSGLWGGPFMIRGPTVNRCAASTALQTISFYRLMN